LSRRLLYQPRMPLQHTATMSGTTSAHSWWLLVADALCQSLPQPAAAAAAADEASGLPSMSVALLLLYSSDASLSVGL
jgi:hypothetical protein